MIKLGYRGAWSLAFGVMIFFDNLFGRLVAAAEEFDPPGGATYSERRRER